MKRDSMSIDEICGQKQQELKKLANVDDYREAWRLGDAGDGWIAYREEVDYYCPPDVIGFDRDMADGGVCGLSDTELELSGFLFEIQPDRPEVDLRDAHEYARRAGIRVEEGPTDVPLDPVTKDMLDHEPYLLKDSEAGGLWKRLRKNARLEYALLVYGLHRQKWAGKWVGMTNRVLLELDKHDLDVSRLRTLKRIDAMSIERARAYKKAAARVPMRLRETLRRLEKVTSEGLAVSSAARPALEQQLVEYRSFLEEYKQRRERRFETFAEHHFETLAGEFKGLLDEPRGRPTLKNLARRVSKAVFMELADELIHTHGVSLIKSTLLAGQITCLLFPNERVTGKTEPFEKTFAKQALNEYKYAKASLPSV